MALPVLQGTVATTYDGVDSNPKTLDLPASIAAGELVLLLVTSGTENLTMTPPLQFKDDITNMTLAHQWTDVNMDCEVGVYWGLGSDFVGVSTVETNTETTDIRANIRSYAMRWSGVDLITPLAAFVDTVDFTSPYLFTGTTSTLDDSKIIALFAGNDGGSPPLTGITAGWTSQAEHSQASHSSAWLTKDQVTAGASGNLEFSGAISKKAGATIFVLNPGLAGDVPYTAPPNMTVAVPQMGIVQGGDLVTPPAITVASFPMTITGSLVAGGPITGILSDEIRRVTGLGIEAGLASHFSKTTSESLQDAERRWLIAAGGSGGTNEDMWVELHAPGSDVMSAKLAYWNTQ